MDKSIPVPSNEYVVQTDDSHDGPGRIGGVN